ncbi:MAG: NAD(P)-dependent oxidoreductase [Bacteroidia bacterium]|jgi:saccharopine dehydrogenase (NAD+, L-lysine forming)
MQNIRLGIIREGKVPPDHRVPLIPQHCQELLQQYGGLEILVQPSDIRCFPESAYEQAGCIISEDLSSCDILMGVKEVPVSLLLANKTYLFFSHVIKRQPYNRKLMQALLQKKIRMIDYELITFDNGKRAVAFGHYAGVVGTHNGLLAYGQRTKAYQLKPAHAFRDYAEMRASYTGINLPPMKVVVTGTGRVGAGAVEMLSVAGLRKVRPEEFLQESFREAVYCELRSKDLYRHKNDLSWDGAHFHAHPSEYVSIFAPYCRVADLMINTIFWDPRAPVFFTKADMREADFNIKTIADITCDIEGSIPSTLRASTIPDPVYGYDPIRETETNPYALGAIDVMAVDNLPCELPVDASKEFSYNLVKYVMHLLLSGGEHDMIERASICSHGALRAPFEYLGRGYAFEG